MSCKWCGGPGQHVGQCPKEPKPKRVECEDCGCDLLERVMGTPPHNVLVEVDPVRGELYHDVSRCVLHLHKRLRTLEVKLALTDTRCSRCERSRDDRLGERVVVCRRCYLELGERPSRASFKRLSDMLHDARGTKPKCPSCEERDGHKLGCDRAGADH